MANAFIPDEKRRHQYFPVNEDPPDYDSAFGRTDEAGPSRGRRTDTRSSRNTRRRSSASDRSQDDVDALNSGEDGDAENGHHAEPHRANSEDSSMHEFHELELDDGPTKEPIHVRLSKEFHRITARVDKVLDTYVNATVMRYVYGLILGFIIVGLVYIFGGSIPKITVAKHYQEDALRVYINQEMSASKIEKFTEKAASIYAEHHQVEALFDSAMLAEWVHSEFVKLGVARNAIDNFYVYYPRPSPDGQLLEIRDSRGESFAASLVDDHGRLRSYITHGASGNVTGPLIFSNYATPDDFSWLSDSGIEVQNSIVIFKQNPAVDLADQIFTAQEAGVAGCIIYSSADDFGEARGPVWPNGPYMPKDSASNGDAALTWIQPGDPLTPGFPSSESTRSIEPDESPALVRIPAVTISASEADTFLEFLQQHGIPINANWSIGSTVSFEPFTGSNSEDAPQVNLVNLLTQELKHPVHDVLSELDGGESDQVLIVGTSLSSPSSVGVMLEVARIFADLVSKYEWSPRRSIVFAVWDKTEQNYMGSTEWVETQLKSIRHQGLAYLNLGNAVSFSDDMQVRATPSLSQALLQAMQHVPNAYGNATVAEDQGLSMLSTTAEPSGFSDSIGFEAHAGVAVADIGFVNHDLYSGCVRSVGCISQHIDPGFANHLVLAKTFAMIILELVDEKFIPLDIHAYARSIEADVRSLSPKYPQLDFGGDLNKVMQQFDYKTDTTMSFQNEWNAAWVDNKEIETPVLSLRRSNWNYAVSVFHRNLLRSTSWTTWFEHPVYGPSQSMDGQGRRSWLFPRIEDAVATGDMGKAQGSVEIMGQSLLGAAESIQF